MPRFQLLLLLWLLLWSLCLIAIAVLIVEVAPILYSAYFETSPISGESSGGLILLGWIAALIVTLLLLALSSVVITNRIAGPVYRVMSMLEDVAKGDYSGQMRLRRKDAFPELADQFNEAVNAIQQERASFQGQLDSLRAKIGKPEPSSETEIV